MPEPDLRVRGQTGQLPRDLHNTHNPQPTTSTKTVKNYYLRKHKNTFYKV